MLWGLTRLSIIFINYMTARGKFLSAADLCKQFGPKSDPIDDPIDDTHEILPSMQS